MTLWYLQYALYIVLKLICEEVIPFVNLNIRDYCSLSSLFDYASFSFIRYSSSFIPDGLTKFSFSTGFLVWI